MSLVVLSSSAIVGCQLIGSIEARRLGGVQPTDTSDGSSETSKAAARACAEDTSACEQGRVRRCTDGGWESLPPCAPEAPACFAGSCVAARGVALGDGATCAVEMGARVRCWGTNRLGQIGDSTTTDRKGPQLVSEIADATDVASGPDFACVRRANGTASCWGSNLHGQLGDPAITTYYRPYPALIPDLDSVLELALGSGHGCARTPMLVSCWGSNRYGQLGTGAIGPAQRGPTPVEALGADVVQIAASDQRSCAVKGDGTLVCWGASDGSSEHDDSRGIRATPTAVTGLGPVRRVGMASGRSCAALRDGSVWCWGDRPDATTPVPVVGVAAAVDVRLGAHHTCALTEQGTLVCWGSDRDGQLGRDRSGGAGPAPIVDLLEVASFDLGASHTCARTYDAAIFCWGANRWGQVGDESTTDQHRPTLVLRP